MTQAEPGKPARLEPPKPPSWWATLRADPPVLMRGLIGLLAVAVTIAVWWAVTRGDRMNRIMKPENLPSPGEVFFSYDQQVFVEDAPPDPDTGKRPMTTITHHTFKELRSRHLSEAILATLQRVMIGVLWASVFGIGLGVIAASFRVVAAALNPLVIFLRSVPMGALLPLTVVFFHIGEKQKEMFIFLAIVPFVFSDVLKAISSVPQRYVETAETLGASRFQIIRKVLFPLALPDIITSLRFQFGLALGYIMLAEALDTKHGIGALLSTGERVALTEQKYLLLFIVALLAFAIDAGIRVFQRGVFPYRKDL